MYPEAKKLFDTKTAIPKETFENIASATDVSNKKAKLIASELRKSQGKKSIEAGFSEDLSKIPKEIIENYIKTVYIPLQVINKKKIEIQREKVVFAMI